MEANMNKINVAVVGAGIYGIHHVHAYLQNPQVNLVGVCDLSAEIREKIAGEYHVKTYTNTEELFANETVDAMSIATPDSFHVEPALHAIEKGVHILVEKPLATSSDDCRKIIRAANAKGIKVGVDFHKRWDPVAINVYKALRDQENTGFPIRGYMSMDDTIDVPTKWFKWGHTSSPVHFLGIHCFDLIRWYMGCEAKSVYAVGSKELLLKEHNIDSYDSVQTIVEFENGCSWVVENSWVLPSGFPKDNDGRTTILTSKKFFRIDSQDRGIQIYAEDKGRTPNVYFFNEWNGKQFGFGVEPINEFIDAVIHDRPYMASDIDGLESAKIAEAAHLSLRTGNKMVIEREK